MPQYLVVLFSYGRSNQRSFVQVFEGRFGSALDFWIHHEVTLASPPKNTEAYRHRIEVLKTFLLLRD
ncbi:unnamed protein product, partial [Nesidiocoris tenuis]